MHWHTRDPDALLRAFKTTRETGLSFAQVEQLHKKYGRNEFARPKRFSLLMGIRKQVLAPLSLVLVLALGIVLFLQEYTDSLVILAALLINVIIGVVQEGKAARVFDALAAAVTTQAIVLRGGTKQSVSSTELVPGDIVFLESGHTVPADVRLLELQELEVNESALTGEWIAVRKSLKVLSDAELPLSSQTNMAFMGTIVTEGAGVGVVVSTGDEAHFGKTAAQTAQAEEERTPLQESITKLAHVIVAIIGFVIAFIFAFGLMRGGDAAQMLLVAVAVAVAAMPEGLPAAVTVTLALAMEQILRQGGLVKRLVAAETLGSTTTILTDKTGTLTQGVMTMTSVHTASTLNSGAGGTSPSDATGDTLEILKMAILASDAFIDGEDDDGVPIVHGRPLEKAIVEGALKAGLRQDELFTHRNNREQFVPFDASRRYAISLNEGPKGGHELYLTGSPEHILSHCSMYLKNGRSESITDAVRAQYKALQDELSATGARFTAVAHRQCSSNEIPPEVRDPQEGENLNFVFGGLLAFSDAVRDDVPEAIATAKKAGIRVLVVTGDHAETARSVAGEVGLANERVLTGTEVSGMTDDALILAAHDNVIFARMLPEQKLRLATVLKEHGEVVAMTGDGVNDAPALTAANIGLAMNDGTDVAKEAADMILLKNGFGVIVTAIRQGRRALTNLRKITAYLLSTSASEIVLIGGAVVIGAPLPLLPAQILWANIVEEGFMSFPFAFEPAEKKIMEQKPSAFNARRGVLGGGLQRMMLVVSLITGGILFALYVFLLEIGIPTDELRTFMFVAVSVDSIFLAFSFKNLHVPLWREDFFSNKYLLVGLVIAFALLALSLTWSPLVKVLALVPLTQFEVFALIVLGVVNILVIEVAKAVFMRKD